MPSEKPAPMSSPSADSTWRSSTTNARHLDRATQSGTHLFNSFTPQPLVSSLAHRLRKANYDTAYVGKRHLASAEPVPEAERGGYQHWLTSSTIAFTVTE